MDKRYKIIFSSLFLLFLFSFILFFIIQQEQNEVFILYAGSLIHPMTGNIKNEFEASTSYNLIGEGKGSIHASNMIMDKQRTPDVFISAGSEPMSRLIDTSKVDWYLVFATSELVFSYSSNSPSFQLLEKIRIGDLNWNDVLTNSDLKLKRTDPELDPKGYYTIMMLQLAEIFYDDNNLLENVIDDYDADQILPEEILVTILTLGQIDIIPTYKHEALSKNLPYFTLPDEINLSHIEYSDFYSQSFYSMNSGKRIQGHPIIFTITIPNDAQNIEGAIHFIEYFLSENNKTYLETIGLHPITPIIYGDFTKVPESLR